LYADVPGRPPRPAVNSFSLLSLHRANAPRRSAIQFAIADDRNAAFCFAQENVDEFESPGSKRRFVSVPAIPVSPSWQEVVCVLHNFLAQWEQAIGWCERARAGAPEDPFTLVHLAAANAWAGHDKEAREAVEQLRKIYSGFTAQTYAGRHYSDDPTFNAQRARIVEGLRKAGLPEGDKKTD
jgi:hypothetical protein